VLQVLKVDDKEKKLYVHFDGWSKRFDEWICTDVIIGITDEVNNNPKRPGKKSVVS